MLILFRFLSLFFLLLSISYSEISFLSLEKGLGLEQPTYANRFVGLGHAGISYITGSGISLKNPSKLAFHHTTSVEAQLQGGFTRLTSNSRHQIFSFGNLSNIGLMIKLGSWGALQSVYHQQFISNYNQVIVDSTFNRSEFSQLGEVFQLNIAYAIAIYPQWSLGLGFYTLLGEIQEQTNTSFSNPLFLSQSDTLSKIYQGTYINISSTFRSLGWNFAISGDIPISLKQETTITASNQLINDLTTSKYFQPPLRYTIGINKKITNNKNFVLDISLTKWDKELTQSSQTFFPHLGIGYEYAGNKNPFVALYKRIIYRVGIGYEQIYNAKANIYRFTAGIGLPIQQEGLFDLNIETGLRQWKNSTNTNEQYFKFYISFLGFSSLGS